MDATGEEEWSDWEDEDIPARSLFEEKMLPSAKEVLQYDKDTYGFDVLAIKTKLGLDFYGCVKLVNFVRAEISGVQENVSRKAAAGSIETAAVSSQGSAFADDRYLRPVLEDDALLLCLEELLLHPAGARSVEEQPEEDEDRFPVAPDRGEREAKGTTAEDEVDDGCAHGHQERTTQASKPSATGRLLSQERGEAYCSTTVISKLEKENASLREALQEAEARMARANEVLRSLAAGGDGEDADSERAAMAENRRFGVDNDSYYFRSYAHWGVHETMLTDTVRTGAYERAIGDNAAFFKGKVVLDVGCGTGVLSCFAARAGARKVIGVDRSEIVVKARDVVRDNGFDGVVTLVKGKVEDVDIGVGEVDVIISEWMGYCLFYESMLPSVIFARDKYLAKGGVVLPDRTPLFIQGWRDPDGRLQFWKNVHGLDFSSMAHLPLDEASVEVVRRADLATERCLCQDFNIETVKDENLDFEAPFEMIVTSPGTVSGLVLSFDAGFFARSYPPPSPLSTATREPPSAPGIGGNSARRSRNEKDGRPSVSWFSTGPESHPTHWKQTLLWLWPSEKPEMLEAGDVISGRLALHRDEVNPRELRLKVTWAATQRSTSRTYGGEQRYHVC